MNDHNLFLVHTSAESQITPRDDGPFGKFLFFSEREFSTVPTETTSHPIAVDPSKIIDAGSLWYQDNWEDARSVIDDVMDAYSVDEDTAMALLDESLQLIDSEADVSGFIDGWSEACWNLQRKTAEAAELLGFDGVAVEDESGVSYMLPASFIDSHKYIEKENAMSEITDNQKRPVEESQISFIVTLNDIEVKSFSDVKDAITFFHDEMRFNYKDDDDVSLWCFNPQDNVSISPHKSYLFGVGPDNRLDTGMNFESDKVNSVLEKVAEFANNPTNETYKSFSEEADYIQHTSDINANILGNDKEYSKWVGNSLGSDINDSDNSANILEKDYDEWLENWIDNSLEEAEIKTDIKAEKEEATEASKPKAKTKTKAKPKDEGVEL